MNLELQAMVEYAEAKGLWFIEVEDTTCSYIRCRRSYSSLEIFPPQAMRKNAEDGGRLDFSKWKWKLIDPKEILDLLRKERDQANETYNIYEETFKQFSDCRLISRDGG